jgi:hypothetical protein
MRFKRWLVSVLCLLLCTTATFPLNIQAQSVFTSQNPSDYTPHVLRGNINQYALVGTTMYAGGTISTVTSANGQGTYNRNNVMAFNALDGHMLGFAPRINGEVWGLEPTQDGKYLYISGSFSQVDGVERRGVVKYDLVNRKVDTRFDAKLDARATVVKLLHGQLIVAGSFNKVGSANRTAIASVDPETGAVTSYLNLKVSGTLNSADPTRIYRLAVNPDSSRMVIIGNFTAISGQSRRQAAMIKLTAINSALSGWNSLHFYGKCSPATTSWIFRDVDWSEDGSYFVLVSTGGAVRDSLCDTASRWDWPSKQSNPAASQPTWRNYTGGDTLHSVEIAGNVVYVGGHQRWLNNPYGADSAGPGAVSRPGIGALSAVTGNAHSWNPTRTRGIGAKELYYTRLPGATGLWVGSDTDELGHEYHASIGFFPQ